MKSIITLTIACFFSFASQAQNFVYSTDQHVSDEVFTSSVKAYDINFTTPQAEGIIYEWERLSNTIDSSWSYSLCDYGSCHIGVPTQGTMTSISLAEAQGGMEGFFKLSINIGNAAGEGFLELYVFDSQDHNRGDTVSFRIKYSPTQSTGEFLVENQSLSFYPNPATDEITIETVSTDAEYLIVSNVIGQHIIKQKVDQISNQKLNLSSLKEGVYFLSLVSESGILETKRLVIN